ncbi:MULTISPECIES: suppressor of fused domain protein [unclassified Bacillus (in: firmicutes)]|uniref:suppressor of fused domain protein n=1 Tax=unclassified Bacillus (in: firmicutes) TaxID=185979 RepID=UPI0008EE64A8|nr:MULTISPECIES: suppressor of fused domain protein [unclassified Bacillus (in: firmicutes)]SFA99788.1 Suppressor of fused protein (SUFU) [Bacillus sp. UNCCL13]SFQ81801.1 Suppressor of fused protein (SUFU) [Bacillus sp. cl95]
MDLEQYKKHAAEQEDWAPGWEAIDEVFNRLYPNQSPAHYGTDIQKRAIFGGDQYLDGYSIFESSNDYKHILTYGLSELYVNEEAFEGKWSGWGYEMTIKLKEESNEDCLWAINMLANLARYTYTQERFFEPMQFVAGNGKSIHLGVESAITALLVVNDTEAMSIDTVHGKVDFLQLVGITQRELEVLKEDNTKAPKLVENMKRENPNLVTDMKRKKSFL